MGFTIVLGSVLAILNDVSVTSTIFEGKITGIHSKLTVYVSARNKQIHKRRLNSEPSSLEDWTFRTL